MLQYEIVGLSCFKSNFKNALEIIKINMLAPSLATKYKKMQVDKVFYARVWKEVKRIVEVKAKEAGKDFNIYIHSFGNYFKNRYS